MSLVYLAFAVFIEMTTFSVMGLGMFPTYFLLDFLLMLLVSALIFVIPFTVPSVVLSSLMLTGQGLVSLFNANLFQLYGDLFTVDLLKLSSEAAAALSLSYVKIPIIFIYISLLALAIGASVICAVYNKDKFDFKRESVVALSLTLVLALVLCPTAYALQVDNLKVEQNPQYLLSVNDRELYKKFTYKTSYFNKFGTYPMYLNNVVFGKRVGGEEDADLNEFKQYLEQGKESFKGQYFGADKGNNLIVIMMESMDTFLIHPKYTPTIYNLRAGGIDFTGYYSQAKTDYAEASLILGSYPLNINLIGNVETQVDASGALLDRYKDFYDFSLPNVLKSNGFDTVNYFHLNEGSFYSRDITHRVYGFDEAYFTDTYNVFSDPLSLDFDYISSWSLPERWFLEAAQNEFAPQDKRFMSFLTSINAHGGYADSDFSGDYAQSYKSRIADADFESISGTPYYKYFKNALAEAMVLDDGISYMMEMLEQKGLLDNTTILFFTDHNAYANELCYLMKETTVRYSKAFNVPAFIYSPNVKNIQINKFTTVFDLSVTLLELLGIEYNPNLYLGYSAFDPNSTSVYISRLGGIFNNAFFTDDATEPVTMADYVDETNFVFYFDEFQTNYVKLRDKWKYINMLYRFGPNPHLHH